MELSQENILRILDPTVQFILPKYQRHYCWEEEQCKRLWNDIVQMIRDNRGGHFIGSIVNINDPNPFTPGKPVKFQLIDGQQRIATLMLILIAIRDYASQKSITDINAADNYLKNNAAIGLERYKLLLTGEDQDIMIQLINNEYDFTALQDNADDEDDDNTPVVPKLIAGYNFFKGKLTAQNPDLTPQEIYNALGKLKIVNITLDQNDDPQAIFESLNSSGKDLSQSDLIRNFILMGLEQDNMNNIYDNYWAPMEKLFGGNDRNTILMDNFFKDYLTLQLGRIPKENQLYEEFKAWRNSSINDNQITDLCYDIYRKAKYYTDIKFARSNNNQLKKVYAEIKELKMEVIYPFLLKIHADCFKGDPLINTAQLIEIMKLCISYAVRRTVCGLSSNGLGNLFAAFRRRIDNKNYTASINQAFSNLSGTQKFPDDNEFAEAFKTCELYKKRRCNYILGQLANFQSRDYFNPRNFTIEHVMPQTLTPEWKDELGADYSRVHKKYLHTVGNLTLTKYNSEMSNRSFIEKKTMEGGFIQSGSRLNSYICMQDTWNENKIKDRAEKLAEQALLIWPGLNAPAIADNIPDEVTEADAAAVTQEEQPLNIQEIFERLDRRINNLAPGKITREKFTSHGYDVYQYKFKGQNITAVTPQQIQVRIFVKMDYNNVVIPSDKVNCHEYKYNKTFGNGNVRIYVPDQSTDSYIDDVMEIIEQAFERIKEVPEF